MPYELKKLTPNLIVSDVARSAAFYRDVLGFEVQANLGSAAFVSAGGYHHHLGFNLWRGHGVPPAPAGSVGLRHWTILLPADAAAALRERVIAAGAAYEDRPEGLLARDPWDIALLVVAEG